MSLHKKCPYLELFWSVFSRILTEYGDIRSISPYSVRMRENADQNNFEYRHFSPSAALITNTKAPDNKIKTTILDVTSGDEKYGQ